MSKKKSSFIPVKGLLWVNIVIPVILVLGVLFFAKQSLKASEKATFEEFNRRQLIMAKEATSAIEQYFETLSDSLTTLGMLPDIYLFKELNARHLLELEFNTLKRTGINDIAILDSKGFLKYNITAPQIEGKDFSWRKYFIEAKEMEPDNTYIIQFIEFMGVQAGQTGVLIAVPMFENKLNHSPDATPGKFAGVILCTLKLTTLVEKFIAPVKSSSEGHSFLIDDEFHILWMDSINSREKKLLKGVPGHMSFPQILEKMISGNPGTSEFSYYKFDMSSSTHTEDKGEGLIAYAPVHLGKELWAVGVWAPKENVRGLIRSVYIKQVLLVSIVILIIFMCSTYTLVISKRYNAALEKNVEEKTREFKEAHHRLLTVLDSMDAMVYVIDMKTHEVLFGNKYLKDLFGDAEGKLCWQVIQKGQSGPCDFCSNKHLLTPDGRSTGVYQWELKNTINNRWYWIHDRAISWVDGRIVNLKIATDITEQKQAEINLKRIDEELGQANEEMKIFCHILQEIGTQKTLDGVGSFLIKELQAILKSHYMLFYVFSNDHINLFALSEKGAKVIRDDERIEVVSELIQSLDGTTTFIDDPLPDTVIPEDFPEKWQQVVIPLKTWNNLDGVFIASCKQNYIFDDKELNMVSLILKQASGTIKRAILHEEEVNELKARIEIIPKFRGIIGKDPKMQVIYKLIEDIAPTDSTVLIQGESGTGKELAASAIRRQSLRKNNPFVVVNCAAYPDNLLESELFGHEKGAFTGATRQKTGRFEQAHGGTLFIDEVGEIAPSAQIKLLRVLQTQKFERIGGEETINVDVRILAATNRELLQEVKDGNFREDLFYRLNVIPLKLPPLKDRRNDIPLLVKHFQLKYEGEDPKGISSEAMRRLLDHQWPGNVRELENSIEHAIVLAKGDRIELSHLPSALCNTEFSDSKGQRGTIIEHEKKLLLDALGESGWNKKQAALRLGISRSTLYGKLRKYKITKPTLH